MEETQMDGSIWLQLPEPLMISVLVRLPISTNLQMRRVCKAWNKILRDPVCLTECAQSWRRQEPFCAAAMDEGKSMIFSPAVRRWTEFPQSWLSGRPSNHDGAGAGDEDEDSAALETLEIVASAGGLLLVQGKGVDPDASPSDSDSDVSSIEGDGIGLAEYAFISRKRQGRQKGRRSLLLLNPLNKSRRQLYLPRSLRRLSTSFILGMSADARTGAHKIFMVHREMSSAGALPIDLWRDDDADSDDEARSVDLQSDPEYYQDEDGNYEAEILWTVYSYEMETDSWDVAFSTKPGYDHILLNAAVVDDEFFLLMLKLILTDLGMCVPHYRVFKVTGENCMLEVTSLPDLGFKKIFAHEGRLMLADWTDPLWDEPCVMIWELEEGYDGVWVKKLQMHEELVIELYKFEATGIRFDAEGDYVCFSNQSTGQVENVTIICDIRSGEWKRCPFVFPSVFWAHCGPTYLFEPRLDVFV